MLNFQVDVVAAVIKTDSQSTSLETRAIFVYNWLTVCNVGGMRRGKYQGGVVIADCGERLITHYVMVSCRHTSFVNADLLGIQFLHTPSKKIVISFFK
jgi:hypothetical protein